jgi:phospholipid/cholesterol/gamma-HCH transport system ATP-binding protein
VQMRNVRTTLDGTVVLQGVDLYVARGTVHFVLGVSGAGKSVILKHLVGWVALQQGDAVCMGQDLRGLSEAGFMAVRQKAQLVSQHGGLLEHLTVLQNVALALRKRGLYNNAAEAEDVARQALRQVQAEDLADRDVASMGLGLQKRVAIARALALRPTLILYDEPTTGLDPVAARRCDALIKALAHGQVQTQLVVSHDLISVRDVADFVSFLHAGRITFTGTAVAFFASQQPEVRQFIDP